MKIKFSKHAQNKIKERRIRVEDIENVLKNPNSIFYDVDSKAFVSIAEIEVEEIKINLIVVHKKEGEAVKVITAYPCKNIEREVKRKEGLIWIRIK